MEPSSNYAYHILGTLLKDPDKTILVINDESVTCKEFHQRTTALVTLLKKQGLKSRQRVLATVSLGVDFYCLAIAVFAAGGILVLADPAVGLYRLNHCIASVQPDLWIFPQGSIIKWLKFILPSIRAIPNHVELATTEGSTSILPPDQVTPAQDALITFTTGSTGLPKFLIRKHSYIMKQSKALSACFNQAYFKQINLEESEVTQCTNLPVFPLHYLKVGSCSIIVPKFTTVDERSVIDKLAHYKNVVLSGSVGFVDRIARYAQKHNMMLPVIITGVGGAPVYRSVCKCIASVTPNNKMAVVYGSTEAEPISWVFAEEKLEADAKKPDGLLVGLPFIEGGLKIIDVTEECYDKPVDVSELELAPHSIGEIIISGWHVNTNEVSKDRLIRDLDGTLWLRIGDAGYVDKKGRVWLAGRVKWRVVNEATGEVFWSHIVEQKILDRTSLITFVVYLNHKGKAHLFIEAPNGLPPKEREGLDNFIKMEGMPVDHMSIQPFIKKDRRHNAKPDTAALFESGNSSFSRLIDSLSFVLFNNPSVLLTVVAIIVLCISIIVLVLF